MSEKKGLVLCVDDEPNIVRSLQWLLQKEFDVKVTTSAKDGLALARDNDFDVVVSDQRMPEMTGVEFLREMRRIRPRAMRILLTGYSDMKAILSSVNESEVFRFVTKPWNINDLPRLVEQAASIARAQPAVAPDPEPVEAAPLAAAGETVLLIDDDPESLRLLTEATGGALKLRQVGNLARAVDVLNEVPVSVIVSELKVGGLDATRLIHLMKGKYPSIVSIIMTQEGDANLVMALINQGQIYRFVTKPVRPGYLKIILGSALAKHRQIASSPGLAHRHRVEAAGVQVEETLIADIGRAAQADKAGAAERDASFSDKVRAGFRRLFG